MRLPTPNLMLGEWLNRFYDYKSRRVKPSTLRNIGIVIRCHIPPEVETLRLWELTPTSLDFTIQRVKAERMRQYTYQVLNEALERAKLLDLIRDNPMTKVEPIKHKQKRGRALTARERRELLTKVTSQGLRDLFEFYIYSGCRRSEALVITWDDVDLEGRTLLIPGTKTEDSDRAIPISPALYRVLARLSKNGDKLFDYNPDYVSKQFKRYCPGHKLHDLRHNFATICLERGISLKVVSKWLGHTSIVITAKIYTHVLSEYERSEADKLC